MISAALAVLENEEQRNEFAEFYERYKARFYNIALKILDNPEDAEDAVQEAFLEIANKPDTFFSLSDKKRFHYFCAVIRNVAIDMLNKNKRIQTEELSDDVIYRNNDNPLENALFDNISHNEILLFIEHLPDLQREVLILVCLLELPISKASEALRVSENVVYQRLYLAKKAIRHVIDERNENDDGKCI